MMRAAMLAMLLAVVPGTAAADAAQDVLAVDAARDYLYVTDPDAGRVLVYTTAGDCVGSFGQSSQEGVDATQFRTTAGIALDASGNVYVADAGTGRVLRFAPFPKPEPSQESLNPPAQNDGAGADNGAVIVNESTEESLPGVEETVEVNPAG